MKEIIRELFGGTYKVFAFILTGVTLLLIITLIYLLATKPSPVNPEKIVPTNTPTPVASPTATPTPTLVIKQIVQPTSKPVGSSITVKVMDNVTGLPIESDSYTVKITSSDGVYSTIYSKPGIHTTTDLKAGEYIIVATSPSDYYNLTGGCTSSNLCSGDIGRRTELDECARRVTINVNESVEVLCRYAKLGTQ